jgi:tyrosyl-tRNA synthetase
LLEGLDGVNKMSKSLGNYVGINEPAGEMFGKLMSISDTLMWRYFELLSFRSTPAIANLQQDVANGRNPRDIKVLLAQEIVERFHGAAAAVQAAADFDARFRQGAIPDDIPEVSLLAAGQPLSIALVLKQAGLTASTSEALRMIEQGGVRINGSRIDDKQFVVPDQGSFVLQIGKRRYARIRRV